MRPLLIALAALLLSPPAHAQSLGDLAWLEGCWRTRDPGPVITEVWTAPPMPALVGYAYTQLDGRTEGWEQTRIELVDGVPHFIAMPMGNAPVRFAMTEAGAFAADSRLDGDSITFENPAHDFPQRVHYMRVGDRLTAVISRLDGADAVEIHYRRIRCSSALGQ